MNLNFACIYKIENLVNGKKYIGQTQNYRIRQNAHITKLRRGVHDNDHLQKSFDKYGEENFSIEVLEKCEIKTLDQREEYWINKYNTTDTSLGYNIKFGGNSSRGHKMSVLAKQHMSENHADFSGENNPMYGTSLYDVLNEDQIIKWKTKISKSAKGDKNSFYGKKHSDDTKKQISIKNKEYYKTHNNPNLGKHLSDETKLKIKENRVYHKGINSSNTKKVICLNTNQVFDLVKFASEYYNIARTEISSCCSHNRDHAGYLEGEPLIWMLYDDYIENGIDFDIKERITYILNKNKGANNINAKSVICLNTNQIFDTVTEASKFYNIDPSSIVKCCKGKINSAGKSNGKWLHWDYYDHYLNCANF